MSKFRALIALLAVAAITSIASAEVTGFCVAADNDGAITCTSAWTSPTMQVNGVQTLLGPAHIIADSLTTDTETDPTISMLTSMENDTGVAWSSYQIIVGVRDKTGAKPLTGLSLSASVDTPADWTANITQNFTLTPSFTDADGRVLTNYYLAIIDFSGPSMVAPNDTADLGYTMSFAGAKSYALYEQLTPVPEPLSMSLLALGGLAMLRRRIAR